MEIAIEKKKLSDMDLIKGLRWEVEAIQKELRGLQAGIDGYPMEIDRLTKEIQLFENKSFTAPLDFEVCTVVGDDLELLENERKRFLEAQEIAQQKISELKAQNLREIERVKKQLEAYREARFSRYEKEKERIEHLLEMEKVAIDRLNSFVILEVRPASGKETDSL